MSIPHQLLFVATMNPLDRGVDEVDAAFDRRFAKIAMPPDPQQLQAFLDGKGVATDLRDRVLAFFRDSLKAAERNPYARIGHAYFLNVRNEEDLNDLWEHQLRFVFEKAYRHSRPEFEHMKRSWDRVFRKPGTAGDGPEAAGDVATGPAEAGPADA